MNKLPYTSGSERGKLSAGREEKLAAFGQDVADLVHEGVVLCLIFGVFLRIALHGLLVLFLLKHGVGNMSQLFCKKL